MGETLPKKMKAIRLSRPVGKIEEDIKNCMTVEEVDLPELQSGQVLVKVYYSTINPSDTAYIKNQYGERIKPPCGAGFEGCGVVVSNGGGVFGYYRLGKRVAFYTAGAWAEYIAVDAASLITLPDNIPLEAAANTVVNPMTVLGFMEVIKASKHSSVIHTAAASGLGRMLIRHCKSEKVDIICVVRREEQAETCRKEGAQYVVDTSQTGWQDELKSLAQTLGTKIAFDSVAGKLAGEVLSAMPKGSTLYEYGNLGGDPQCHYNISDLIFQDKVARGFWLVQHIKTKGKLGMMMWSRKITQMLMSEFSTAVSKTVTLDEVPDGIIYYINNMSAGKVLIKVADDPSVQMVASGQETVPMDIDATQPAETPTVDDAPRETAAPVDVPAADQTIQVNDASSVEPAATTETDTPTAAEPDTPTAAEPDTPAVTAETDKPDATAEPDTPATTAEPETPATTAEPETPATTAEPETPATTAEPDTPATIAEPETPATTAEPETPATTAEPETPAATAEPETPAATAEPDTPATTAEPAQKTKKGSAKKSNA